MHTTADIDKIIILDFGSQYTQLIAKKIRSIGVCAHIYPFYVDLETINKYNPKGIVLSGGPASVYDEDSYLLSPFLLELKIPILAICYGMQLIVNYLGGEITLADKKEFGSTKLSVLNSSPLLEGLNINEFNVWMSHSDHVTKLSDDFIIIASTGNCPYAMVENKSRNIFGLQFHPEVEHSEHGITILYNFVTNICKCSKSWSFENIIDNTIVELKDKIGSEKVILALSGGVDSSVAAMLLNKTIGKQLTCIFIDNGLLRLKEAENVKKAFEHFDLNIIYLDRSELFLDALKGIFDPEEKRKVIGHTFIEVFTQEAKKLSEVHWLAQGTIYSDIIESGKGSHAKTIKSHHNVGGLPKDIDFKIIEPLSDLFKNEVREIGLKLGLPNSMLYRHPFPGPGLGIRVLGEVRQEYCDIVRQADNIFTQELINHGLYYDLNQAFVVFIPEKSVGVIGDNRRFNWIVSLRAVKTNDFMTASWAGLPYDFLNRVSTRIINEVPQISRVLYDISNKPPATIEWE